MITDPVSPQALLDWYRKHLCDDNPRSAWHTLHRNGPIALTACRTTQDFELMASVMDIAAILCPPEWVNRDVSFNGGIVTIRN